MYERELEEAINAGLLAQKEIMAIYKKGFEIEIKSDNSPVTLADKNADKIIKEHLSKCFPSHAFLTEESDDDLSRLSNDFVWIIDPVDGTKDFCAKDDEFTTNIALCYKNEVVVGVVLIPAKNELYYAVKGKGSFHRINGEDIKIHVSDKIDNLTCLTSVFHFNENEKDCIEKHKDKITSSYKVGSSIKACYIAEGKAEISYRLGGGTKEWDTAAFQIIVEEAGGLVVKPNGEKMKYNREDVYNHDGYIILNNIENLLL